MLEFQLGLQMQLNASFLLVNDILLTVILGKAHLFISIKEHLKKGSNNT